MLQIDMEPNYVYITFMIKFTKIRDVHASWILIKNAIDLGN